MSQLVTGLKGQRTLAHSCLYQWNIHGTQFCMISERCPCSHVLTRSAKVYLHGRYSLEFKPNSEENVCHSSQARVYTWAEKFHEGRNHVENQSHPRRPRTSITSANVEKVKKLILDNRRLIIREISEEVGINIGSVGDIVRKELHAVQRSECAMGSTTEQDEKQVEVYQDLLPRYEEEGTFLESIHSSDETWVHYSTPESKRASMQWKHKGSFPPLKVKTTPSAGKVMGQCSGTSEVFCSSIFYTPKS